MKIKKGISKLRWFSKPFKNVLDISNVKGLMLEDLMAYEATNGCIQRKVPFVITDKNMLIPQGTTGEYIAFGWRAIDCTTVEIKALDVIDFSSDDKLYSFVINEK